MNVLQELIDTARKCSMSTYKEMLKKGSVYFFDRVTKSQSHRHQIDSLYGGG